MNSADEADRARGKRRLIVAEKCARPRERYSKLIRVHLRAEISRHERWCRWFPVYAKNVAGTVHYGNHHRVGIGGLRGGLRECGHVGRREGVHWGGRRGRERSDDSSASGEGCGQRDGTREKYSANKFGLCDFAGALAHERSLL
jgi:hypothetical protein